MVKSEIKEKKSLCRSIVFRDESSVICGCRAGTEDDGDSQSERLSRKCYLRQNEKPKGGIKEMRFLVPFIVFLCLMPLAAASFHRLQLPDPHSELQIVPRVEVPMSMAPSIQSGMNVRLPITLKFARHGTMSQQSTAKSTSPQEVLHSSRTEARASFYKMVEQASPRIGKVCLLRSICEVGQVPAVSPATGLLGEIVDLLLTCSNFLDQDGILREYREAEEFGRRSWNSDACRSRYSACPFSVFSIVSLFSRN